VVILKNVGRLKRATLVVVSLVEVSGSSTVRVGALIANHLSGLGPGPQTVRCSMVALAGPSLKAGLKF
jgi:hypothetical protein